MLVEENGEAIPPRSWDLAKVEAGVKNRRDKKAIRVKRAEVAILEPVGARRCITGAAKTIGKELRQAIVRIVLAT